MKSIFAAALALLPFSALAEEVVLDRPMAAGSLHVGALDMVAYYMPADEGLKVIATFAPYEAAGEPMRVIMVLADGEGTAFSMPGYADTTYSFRRAGETVAIEATGDSRSLASAE